MIKTPIIRKRKINIKYMTLRRITQVYEDKDWLVKMGSRPRPLVKELVYCNESVRSAIVRNC